MGADYMGWVKCFEVEADNRHVIMTVFDPSEGAEVPVRITKEQLAVMSQASVLYQDGIQQVPTTRKPEA